MELLVTYADRAPDRRGVTEQYTADTPPRAPVPQRLVVALVDGTERSYDARADGPNRWVFDVVLPRASEVASLRIYDSALQPEAYLEVVGEDVRTR
jgi:hypothetical protein